MGVAVKSMRATSSLISPRRLDIAVKFRFFRHLQNSDPGAEALYAFHIVARSGARMQAGVATDVWKRGVVDYVFAAKELYRSMRLFGFDPDHAIPIDPDGELFNGSHRVACALALGIEEIPVVKMPGRVWAPAWDAEWFRAHGLDEGTIASLQKLTTFTQQA